MTAQKKQKGPGYDTTSVVLMMFIPRSRNRLLWTTQRPGGVCPFGVKDGVEVYLDESLRQFETVYPAAGNDHSAVRLTIPELDQAAGARGWVDVCRARTEPVADAAK